jgi:DNA-binding SARP family transcriptional activator
MNGLKIQLLGKFSARQNGQIIAGLDGLKVQELTSFLLINRNQPHHREKLATLLWSDCKTMAQAKKYLRKEIWRLQTAFQKTCLADNINVKNDWIEIKYTRNYWLDVACLEDRFADVKNRRGSELSPEQVSELETMIGDCSSELLEGRYYEWSIYERERYKLMVLLILDRLVEYYENIGDYATGCLYGLCILRQDPARERTHRRLMGMRYKAGDRTGALRQYHQCAEALMSELAVTPSPKTETLYQQICSHKDPQQLVDHPPKSAAIVNLADHLTQLNAVLAKVQQQIAGNISQIERLL